MPWIVNYANRCRNLCAAIVAWQAYRPVGLSFWRVLRRGPRNCVLIRTRSSLRPASYQACPSKNSPSKWHPCPPVPRGKQGESRFRSLLRNISRQQRIPSPTRNSRPSTSVWRPSPKTLLPERTVVHHRHGVRDGNRNFVTSPGLGARRKSALSPDR